MFTKSSLVLRYTITVQLWYQGLSLSSLIKQLKSKSGVLFSWDPVIFSIWRTECHTESAEKFVWLQINLFIVSQLFISFQKTIATMVCLLELRDVCVILYFIHTNKNTSTGPFLSSNPRSDKIVTLKGMKRVLRMKRVHVISTLKYIRSECFLWWQIHGHFI